MDNLSGLNDPEFVFSPFAAFQVDECYFCKSSSFSNTPSLLQSPLNGYQDELFLLNPNEKPLCDTDPLLLFCIDVSGSMKITSEVQQHYRHLASRGCLWQQVFMNTTCGVSSVFRCQRESILWINPVSRWVVFLFSPLKLPWRTRDICQLKSVAENFCVILFLTIMWRDATNQRLFYSNQFVQEAVSLCVERLNDQQPGTRVGLISFNHEVHTWRCLHLHCLLLSRVMLTLHFVLGGRRTSTN